MTFAEFYFYAEFKPSVLLNLIFRGIMQNNGNKIEKNVTPVNMARYYILYF